MSVILFLLAILLATFCSFWNLNTPSLRPGDEALHASIVQQMVHHGLQTIPVHEGKPYLNKPPLKLWLSALAVRVLGEHNSAYRFIDALCGVLTAGIVFLFGALLFRSSLVGFMSVAALLGSDLYLFEHVVRTAVQDSFLVLASTLAITTGFIALETNSHVTKRVGIVVSGLAVAAGVLVKHVAGLLPLLVLGTYLLANRRLQAFISRELWLITLIAFGSVSLYMIPAALYEPRLLTVLISTEVVERVQQGYHNAGDFWLYVRDLFIERRLVSPELLIFGSILAACLCTVRANVLLLVWAWLPLILFTIPSSRLSWYVAPALPGMALLIGALFSWDRFRPLFANEEKVRAAALPGSILLLVFIALPLWSNLTTVWRPFPRTPIDTATERATAASQNHPGAVILYRGAMPPGTFERVYVRRLARGRQERLASVDLLAERISRNRVALVVAQAKEIPSLSQAGTIYSYDFIPPSKAVPRWMLRRNWIVLMSFSPEVTLARSTELEFLVDKERRSLHFVADSLLLHLPGIVEVAGCHEIDALFLNDIPLPFTHQAGVVRGEITAEFVERGENRLEISHHCTLATARLSWR